MFYTLNHAGFCFVVNKIKKLNKIAEKLGQEKILFELIKKEAKTNPKTLESQMYYHIMCIGEAPKLKDWAFRATLDFTPKGNLFNTTYDYEAKNAIKIPDRFRNTPFTLCEDCGVKRYRTKVFILHNEKENKWMQVGSTCLGAFLGVNESEVHQLAEFATTLATMPSAMKKWNDKMAKSKKNNDYIGYKIGDLLSAMFLNLNEQWKKYASYYSLISYAYRAVRNVSYYGVLSTVKQVTQKERDMSTAMLKYFETWKSNSPHIFYSNMLVVLKNLVVSRRHYKFLAEAFQIYIKNNGRQLYTIYAPKSIVPVVSPALIPQTNGVTQIASPSAKSTYLGTIGSRNDLNLDTVVTYSSRARRGSFVVLKDASGNELSWICPYFYRVNDKIHINQAFILKHQEYKGVCQTVISAVTFVKK